MSSTPKKDLHYAQRAPFTWRTIGSGCSVGCRTVACNGDLRKTMSSTPKKDLHLARYHCESPRACLAA